MLKKLSLIYTKNKRLLKFIQLIVSCSLLIYLFLNVKYNLFLSNLRNVNWILILVIILIGHLSIIISSLKAKSILKNTSFWRITKVNYICFFYGIFVPGSITSDLFKLHYFKKNGESIRRIIGQIFLDRFSGLIAIGCYLLIGIYFFPETFYNFISLLKIKNNYVLVGGILLFILASIIILFFKKIKKILKNLILKINFREFKFPAMQNIFLALCFQLISIIMFYLTLKATFIYEIPFTYLIFVVSFTTLVSFIPISIQNIGVSENLYVLFLVNYGFSFENVLLISLVNYSILLTKAFIGFYFSVREK